MHPWMLRLFFYIEDDHWIPRSESKPINKPTEIVIDAETYTRLLKDMMDGSRILKFMETKKGCDQVTRQHRMDEWLALYTTMD
uniref:DEAD-box ATP-dependent RNA helicase 30 n=1 Tax=Tanacetum cinerariifolium TaxID=118510 RepID=A0A6L2NYI8_TANCI|nr:DEAD-box ATP-dependent RNA helicase 30 [Tanacetum cinerariifolium]